jgi:hypothetical protein
MGVADHQEQAARPRDANVEQLVVPHQPQLALTVLRDPPTRGTYTTYNEHSLLLTLKMI